MRLIDADKLKQHYSWWNNEEQRTFDQIVDAQHTVDAVPVVRCRECRHWIKGENVSDSWEFCDLFQREIGGEQYCSYGERKDKLEGYYVRCGNDDCTVICTTCNRETPEEAANVWNRRADNE